MALYGTASTGTGSISSVPHAAVSAPVISGRGGPTFDVTNRAGKKTNDTGPNRMNKDALKYWSVVSSAK